MQRLSPHFIEASFRSIWFVKIEFGVIRPSVPFFPQLTPRNTGLLSIREFWRSRYVSSPTFGKQTRYFSRPSPMGANLSELETIFQWKETKTSLNKNASSTSVKWDYKAEKFINCGKTTHHPLQWSGKTTSVKWKQPRFLGEKNLEKRDEIHLSE